MCIKVGSVDVYYNFPIKTHNVKCTNIFVVHRKMSSQSMGLFVVTPNSLDEQESGWKTFRWKEVTSFYIFYMRLSETNLGY